MSKKLWAGRFSESTDRLVERFTSSIQFDKRLYEQDIAGSIAHCRMLEKIGVITAEERDALVKGLEQIQLEIEDSAFVFDDSLEDIHMHIEARLFEIVGPVARKLHTARSRNDQVALDIRLYLRQEIRQILSLLKLLRKALVNLASENLGVVMPGYTHMQRAQPVLLSHHLMAYFEMFSRDADRLRDVLGRTDVMPLGSAALAGTTYPIDRGLTARLLEFPAITANSMDAVADRDFAIEFAAAASICMMHFSRLSEELILWSSSEFGFVEISDAFTTGSSIMPQKKNPDVCELVRGKAARVFGDLVALLTLMKSLPMTYNRDMQEDKEPLFDAADTLRMVLSVYVRMLPQIVFKEERMAGATTTGYLNATDLADYLVAKGIAFREAHHIVGRAVSHAISIGRELHELSLDELHNFCSAISEDVYEVLTTEQMLDRRRCFGGTAESMVRKAVEAAATLLEAEDETAD